MVRGRPCLLTLWLLWLPGGERCRPAPGRFSPHPHSRSPAQSPPGSPALFSCGEACGLFLLLAWGSEQRGPARAQRQTLPFIFPFSFPPACCFFHSSTLLSLLLTPACTGQKL